jgi:thiol-disulfide isomerase/thioredoxin
MTKKITLLLASTLCIGLISAQVKSKDGLKMGRTATDIAYGTFKAPKAVTHVFAYDNHEVGRGLGLSSVYQIGMGIELPVNDLTGFVGQKIDYVRFGISNKSKITAISIEIIEDDITNEPVYTQNLTVSNIVDGWNLQKLTTTYEIPSNTNVYIVIQVTNSAVVSSLGMDTDAACKPEYSGFIFVNKEFYKMLSDLNVNLDFCLEAFITDGEGAQLSDLTITDVHVVSTECALSNAEIINVTLKNIGDETIDAVFNLSLDVDDQTVTQSVSPAAFVPGEEMVITMPSVDLSAFKRHKLTASFDYPDDLTNNNAMTTYRSTGDALIQVNLLTDMYPEETSWDITDEAGNTWATNGVLEAETRYVDKICVPSTGCYIFRILDVYGDGMMGNNSPSGTFTIRYNGSVRGTCPTGGDFGSEYYVYGIGGGCPQNDVVLSSIDMKKYGGRGEHEIAGTILNYGTQNLISFEVTYEIGDYISPVYAIDGINIPTGGTYSFTHEAPYDFDQDGKYTVKLNINLPNGTDDERPDDNTLSKVITIGDLQSKKQLLEHFTSSTCSPCAGYTPSLDELLADNAGKYSLIRYQVNWPGNGDPYYNNDVRTRVNYYEVSGVPSVFHNGAYNMSVEQSYFDELASEETPIGVTIKATYKEDNTVNVKATILPTMSLSAGLTVHIAVVEKETTGNVSTNGEKKFHNVLMKMLPDGYGTTLDALTKDEPVNVEEEYDMSTTFVEEISDLRAVVFVQDDETMEVLQSEIVDVELYTDDVNDQNTSMANVYPNPFKGTLNLKNLEGVSLLKITDAIGNQVAVYPVNNKQMSIPTNNFASGIYFVNLISNDKVQQIIKIVKQ